MYKSFSMELAGRTLTVDIGRVAAQANGAALMHYGDTVVLSTVCASEKPREGIDFFPLSVEYEEKLYAVGKIPGGFIKREGKASENAILTSRVIDVAIMIYELSDSPFKRIVQTISYLPHFLSWIVLGGMLIKWFSTTGFVNQILLRFGIIDKPENFLLDSKAYWWIASLSDVWKEAGWGTVLYLATMAGIDPTYYEAAKIDGASRMKQITSITLPLMRNIISLNFILTVSGLLHSNLDQAIVLMNSQNQVKSEVIDSYVYRIGLTQGDFSYATAVGLGISIVSVIILYSSNKLTNKINEESVF